MKRESVIILVLSVLLVGSLGFIGFSYTGNVISNMQMELRNEGYQMAIADLMSPLENCQVVTLSLDENATDAIDVFSLHCLEGMQGQESDVTIDEPMINESE